jgi:hypothetical protein
VKEHISVTNPPAFPYPAPENGYLAEHVQCLCESLKTLTWRELICSQGTAEERAEKLFHAPFVVLSHNADADPVLTYANLAGLQLFEMSWDQLIVTPSRYTAEAPIRDERERLLKQVRRQGYIDDYAGIRVSSSGRRFRIEHATVWNLLDKHGSQLGQAATFDHWKYL